jgi:hypothetical protein
MAVAWETRFMANGLLVWTGRLLCLIGVHDYRLIEEVVGFGPAGTVQKVQCRRCGYVTTRRG